MSDTWDIGDPQPHPLPKRLHDYTYEDYDCTDNDSPIWSPTIYGDKYKGYKNGYKVYLDWDELTRRWGPLTAGEGE